MLRSLHFRLMRSLRLMRRLHLRLLRSLHFRLLRSLGDTALGRSASYESVGAWGAASLIGSAGLTGAVTVLLRSRTKA